MDTYVEKITLARVVAAERTTAMGREPIIVEQRGNLLRGASLTLRGVWNGLTEAFVIPAQKLTYCTFNPSEC